MKENTLAAVFKQILSPFAHFTFSSVNGHLVNEHFVCVGLFYTSIDNILPVFCVRGVSKFP